MRNVTMSTCAVESEHGAHMFEITGYSLHHGLGVGRYLQSANFTVGGHVWCILFFPDGAREDCKDYVFVGIHQITSGIETVRVSVRFRLDHPTTPLSLVLLTAVSFFFHLLTYRITHFIERSQMEAIGYVVGDRLKIACMLTVVKEPRVPQARPYGGGPYAEPPPSDITKHLGKPLETKEEVDVTFKVGEEEFPAHRIVLAMRSPVLKAQLYGPMRENDMSCIRIVDMQPAIFRALLHFIYTDSLPSMDDLDADDMKEMTKHLLVAADRYAMERHKLVCESILIRKGLDVKSVATTLALADQHNCIGLKDACIRFIACLGKQDYVFASQGYVELKRTCPSVLNDMWEKVSRLKRT